MDSYTPAEKLLGRVLNIIAAIHAVLLVAFAIFIFFQQGSSGTGITHTPLDTNGVASLGLLMLLAWFAAADIRRFRPMIYVLIAGFALDVAGAAILLLSPGGGAASVQLLFGIVFSAVIGLIIFFLTLEARVAAPKWQPWMPDKPYTNWEQFARIVCLIAGAASVIATVGHFVLAYNPPSALAAIFAPSLILNGSAVKIGMLGMCMLLAAWDIRRYREFLTVFILGNAISLVIVIIAHIGMNRAGSVPMRA